MNKLGLSNTVENVKPSASLAVAQRAIELAREGRDIVNLSIGEPDFDVPSPIKDGLYQALDNNNTHYTESQGVLELREEIAENIGHDVNADQLILCSGCKLGLYLTLEAVVNPGDEVILLEPAWVSYSHMITMTGGKSVNVQTKEENNFLPTIDEIKAKINDNTKAILVNNPNNPSGQLMPKETLDQIVELAKENDMWIISDEIYSDILYDKDSFYSMLNYDYEKIIMNSGFSKNFAMTGLRLGYIVAANKEIAKSINKLHQHIGTCAPSVSQYSLIGNIKKAQDDVKEMVKVYERRKNLLVEGLKDAVDFITPQATFYMLINISQLDMKSFDASQHILEELGVATVPGIGFGESLDDYVRISFATSDDVLKKAIERFQELSK